MLFSALLMARRLRPILCAATAALSLAAARPGHADLDNHVSAGVSVGQSDQAAVLVDGFVTAMRQLELSHNGRMTAKCLGYGIVGTKWLRGTQGSSRPHTHGPSTVPTDVQVTGPRPAGDQTFVAVDAGEALAWQTGGSWRIDETYRPRMNDDRALIVVEGFAGSVCRSYRRGFWLPCLRCPG